ncbi:hypothetical protein [Chondrinema litorale]|uniref:hypothetical protein n=1 Tax=Chondrinema litorale TaxID=2994555 RepID=UPI0025434B22|nr:hypothetical protein [Chondrinema litorale]UZR98767.1 hypothetical protein OQ292_33510 [Chondrinema litorale]
MKKKQLSEENFDFFNVNSELKKYEQKPAATEEENTESAEVKTEAKKAKNEEKSEATPVVKKAATTKKKVSKVDELFVIEEEEKDPFKTVQVRTSLWKKAEEISKKIESKTGKKYSATKVLNRILEDYFA